MKTPEQYEKSVRSYQKSHGRHFGVFIADIEHISHNVLLFPLLTLNKRMPAEYPRTRHNLL